VLTWINGLGALRNGRRRLPGDRVVFRHAAARIGVNPHRPAGAVIPTIAPGEPCRLEPLGNRL
jgi:hypothetical protein